MSDGNIYFLQVGADGPIKIGFTKNDIKRRVREIQCGSPHVLRWIGYYPGDRSDERSVQLLLLNSSLRGEWFHPTVEVLAFVRQQCPNFEPLVVENVLIPARRGKVGGGARPIRIARPAWGASA